MKKLDLKNEEDFKMIYDEHFNMVYRISILYLKNTEEAEDVTQEVFIKLINREESFNDMGHIKAWLITVTKNLSKDRLKNFWKTKRVDIEKLPEISNEDTNPQLYYVLEELLLLPDKYKLALYLFYYENYSVKEISEVLDIKDSTIQTQLARGRKMLEKRIEGRLHE